MSGARVAEARQVVALRSRRFAAIIPLKRVVEVEAVVGREVVREVRRTLVDIDWCNGRRDEKIAGRIRLRDQRNQFLNDGIAGGEALRPLRIAEHRRGEWDG